MNYVTQEKPEVLSLYGEKDFDNVPKEKDMTLQSTLADMHPETAGHISKQIPQYFDICEKTIDTIKSSYETAVEAGKDTLQLKADSHKTYMENLQKCYDKAETPEERKEIRKEMEEEERRYKEDVNKSNTETNNNFGKLGFAALAILIVGASVLGVSVKFGKPTLHKLQNLMN